MSKLTNCNREIELLNKQKYDLVAKVSDLSEAYDNYKESCDLQLKALEDQNIIKAHITKMQTELVSSAEENEKLKASNNELAAKLAQMQSELLEMETEHAAALQALNDRLAIQKDELKTHQSTEQLIKEKYEKLIVQHETMKNNARATDEHLEAMRNEIAVKELEMGKLGTEIVDVHRKNNELEERIDQIVSEYKNEKQNSDMALNLKDERIKEIDKERSRLLGLLEDTKAMVASKSKEIEKSKEEIKLIVTELNNIKLLLDVPLDDESDIFASCKQLVTKIKETIEQKKKTTDELERVLQEKNRLTEKLHTLEQTIQKMELEKQQIHKKHVNDLNEVKMELQLTQNKINQHEEKIDELNVEQNHFLRKMQAELNSKDEELNRRIQQAKLEKDKAIEQLEQHVNIKRKEIAQKENELLLANNKNKTINEKLTDAEKQLLQLQLDNENRRESYEKRLSKLATNNDKLAADIVEFRKEHDVTEQYRLESDSSIKKVLSELQNITNAKSVMSEQLEASQDNLLRAEEKLKNMMKDNQCLLNELHAKLADTEQKLLNAETQIQTLDQLRTEHTEIMSNQTLQLHKCNEEKQQMHKEIAAFASQLECEQKEKGALLLSLEKTADQLKASNEAKFDARVALEKRCNELEQQSIELSAQLVKVQETLDEKIDQLHYAHERHKIERDNCHAKINELKRSLDEKTTAQEQTIIEILAVIDENACAFDSVLEEVPPVLTERDLFAGVETESGSKLCQLKKSLNKIIAQLLRFKLYREQVDQMHQEHNEHVKTLTDSNANLTNQITRCNTEIVELQNMLTSEAKNIENHFFSEYERLNDNIKELNNLNLELTHENQILQTRIVGSEQEIENIKSKIEQFNAEKAKMYSREEECMVALEKLREENIALMANIKKKEFSVDEAREKCAELDKLRSDNELLAENLKEQQGRVDEWQEKYAEVEKLHEEIKTLTDYIADQQAIIDEWQCKYNEVTELREENEKLGEALKEQRGCIDEYKEKYAELKSKTNDKLKWAKGVEQDYEFATEECTKLQTELDELHVKYMKLTEIMKQTEMKSVEAINERVALQQDLEKKEALIEQSQTIMLSQEESCKELRAELRKINLEYQTCRNQNKTLLNDIKRLTGEVDAIQADKSQLLGEFKESKRELQRTNTNVSQLIAQIGSIRLEKEKITNEHQKLRKESEELTKSHTNLEVNLKLFKQRAKSLESKLATCEAELTALRTRLEKSESTVVKLSSENDMLRETNEGTNKRIEKMALKLGECQARCSKLERDNEKLTVEAQAQIPAIEALQREKETMSERLQKYEQTQEQMMKKIQSLEQLNTSLEKNRKKLESNEFDFIKEKERMEKVRASHDEKIKKLNHSLNSSELENRRLNLEIGAINSQVAILQKAAVVERERALRNEETIKNLKQTKGELEQSEEQRDSLESELASLRKNNAYIGEQLLNLSLELESTKEKCDLYALGMQEMRDELFAATKEKEQVMIQHVSTSIKLKEYMELNTVLSNNKHQLFNEQQAKLLELEAELALKADEFADLQNELKMKDAVISSLQMELDSKAAAIEELQNELDKKTAIIAQHSAEIDDKFANIKHMQAELASRSADIIGLGTELETKRQELEALRAELHAKDNNLAVLQFELDNNADDVAEYKEDLKTKNLQISALQDDLATKSNAAITLQAKLADKSAANIKLNTEIDILRATIESKYSTANQESSGIYTEMINLREHLAKAENRLMEEQKVTEQLHMDNKILQAKYSDVKGRIIEECKAAEERIKENRLELEGKLEKMKTKMKNLYTEETQKMKTKQERETANLRSEMEVLRAQNSKYEEHTRKLSKQIMLLNDKILELQKQNAILSTKLKHFVALEHQQRDSLSQFKRPSVAAMKSAAAAAPSANLAMEDEEGEVFNNTYLADLKSGRMSELMSKDVGADELRYRNSLLLPHLKSSYAAQYDHGLAEEDLKVRNVKIETANVLCTTPFKKANRPLQPNISKIIENFNIKQEE